MFGSQTLDTAIGLAVLFFIIATAASMIVEVISRIMQKRARDLEKAIGSMLSGEDNPDAAIFKDAFNLFKTTSVYTAAKNATGKFRFGRDKRPSYVSAKAFADAALEMLMDKDNPQQTVLKAWNGGGIPENLKKRLEPLVREARDDIVRVKSGLETWFDETMDRAEGAYKRWTTLWLFLAGLVIAGVGNASTVDVAHDLYSDSATREAVVQAAQNVVANASEDSASTDCATASDLPTDSDDSSTKSMDPTGLGAVACATLKLQALNLPVGWGDTTKEDWDSTTEVTGHLLGWLLTALLVMLGAPFWFDLLSRLVSLRSSGTKPPPAAADPASYTKLQVAEATATPPAQIQAQVDRSNEEPLLTDADVHQALATMMRVGPLPSAPPVNP